MYEDAFATTSLPTTIYMPLSSKASFRRFRSDGAAIFTGKSSGKMNTSGSSAMDMLIIFFLIIRGCVFFDHENSSRARYTSNPSFLIAWTIPLCPSENGSNVPGKNAIFLFSGSSMPPRWKMYSDMNLYMWFSAAALVKKVISYSSMSVTSVSIFL